MLPIPALLLLIVQTPAPLSGTAVDRDGKPIAGVEVVLACGQERDGSVPILSRSTTDARGRYDLAAPPSTRPSAGYVSPFLAASAPGSGLVLAVTSFRKDQPGAYRLIFNPLRRRTFTLRGGDGKPLAGVRLSPLTLQSRQQQYAAVTLPDELAERLAATTGPDGRAELDGLEPATPLYALRARIPGLGTCVLGLTPSQFQSGAVTLDLKSTGSLAGRVVRSGGRAVAGAEVEVWSRAAKYYAPLEPVRFEAGPVRTSADGTFRTPTALLAGARYRALVRAEGLLPGLTEWVAPGSKADAVVKLRDVALAPPRSIAGRVVDRQGRPVAGAQVVAGGDDATTATDAMGSFRLTGLAPDHTLLVVKRDGFRISGRQLGPAAGDVKFVLARFDELPSGRMTTLPGVMPLEERRKLARRLLDPYLPKVLAEGNESSKLLALRSLMVYDPAAALEALEGEIFTQRTNSYQSLLRREIAGVMARTDPESAAAVAETISEPNLRARALVDICIRLPESQRARRRQLVDRALVAARAELDPRLKVWQLGEAAELLLDLGEGERAKAVFAEGLPIARQLGPNSIEFLGYFATRLTRIDLPTALDLLKVEKQQELPVRQLGNIAARVAASHPAEAERLIESIRASDQSYGSTMRTCQKMAGTDLARARRIAMSQESAAGRARALVFTASGLPPAERPTARGIVREALAELDQPRDSAWSLHARTIAALMPVVESIDPELVPEFFWRTVERLGVRADPRALTARDDVLRVALLLARYDRDVAAALYESAARSSTAQVTEDGRMMPSELLPLGVIDPRRAVAAVESVPVPESADSGLNRSRIILSELLGRDDESIWDSIWGNSSGLGSVLRQRDAY